MHDWVVGARRGVCCGLGGGRGRLSTGSASGLAGQGCIYKLQRSGWEVGLQRWLKSPQISSI